MTRQGFVDAMRKAYRPLGFSKGYNFPLCEWIASLMLSPE